MILDTSLPLSSALNPTELDVFNSLNQDVYGLELATKVIDKLKKLPASRDGYDVITNGLYHSHRDYCGIGLFFTREKFLLGEVNDGMGPSIDLIVFDNEKEFLNWLAKQSDQSMSLMVRKDNLSFNFNNQTITKIRLEYFLEDEYDPNWNAYCNYLRKLG